MKATLAALTLALVASPALADQHDTGPGYAVITFGQSRFGHVANEANLANTPAFGAGVTFGVDATFAAPAATQAPQADPFGSQSVLGWRAFGSDAFADPLELGQHLDVKGGR